MELNRITKGMDNAAEQIDSNFQNIGFLTQDSGWVNATVDPQIVTSQTIPLAFRKIGKTVYVRGQFFVRPSKDASFTSIGFLPSEVFAENNSNSSYFITWATDTVPLNTRIVYNNATHPEALKLSLEVRGTLNSETIEVGVNTSYMIDN